MLFEPFPGIESDRFAPVRRIETLEVFRFGQETTEVCHAAHGYLPLLGRKHAAVVRPIAERLRIGTDESRFPVRLDPAQLLCGAVEPDLTRLCRRVLDPLVHLPPMVVRLFERLASHSRR